MPDFITEHHGGGWKYQFHIPVKLRPLFRRAAFVRYLKRMPRREALEVARGMAIADAARLAEARSMDSHQREKIEAYGRVAAVQQGRGPLKQRIIWGGTLDATKQIDKAAEHAKVVDELSWDRLFAEWRRARNPRETRDHLVTIRLLKEYFRDCNLREVITSLQIAKFRDHLLASGDTTPGMVKTRLGHIKAMFNGAAKDPTSPFHGMSNPATGIGIRGELPAEMATLPFSPSQVRMILETAARIRFGDTRKSNRHTETMWALRMMAHTGARPNEILQLQGGDVVEENGVKCLRIQETDAVTGIKHPHKSIKTKKSNRTKTDERRVIPLHTDVLDFFDYTAKFAKEPPRCSEWVM